MSNNSGVSSSIPKIINANTVLEATPMEVLVDVIERAFAHPPVAPDLETAAKMADIISSATLSEQPLILGAWLKPGVHVDLVGSFKPNMRETDNEAIQIARVFVDTRAGAFSEAGDLIQPIAANQFSEESVVAELSELCSGKCEGRTSSDEITLFKSVGASLEDLAAAEMLIDLTQ